MVNSRRLTARSELREENSGKYKEKGKQEEKRERELECGPMPNVMVALPNIGGANEELKFRNSNPCPTPQSLADALCLSALQ